MLWIHTDSPGPDGSAADCQQILARSRSRYRLDEGLLAARPALNRLYNLADCLVAASSEESYNLPTLEFLATGGIPVVPDHSAYQEQVPFPEHRIPVRAGIHDTRCSTELAVTPRDLAEALGRAYVAWRAADADVRLGRRRELEPHLARHRPDRIAAQWVNRVQEALGPTGAGRKSAPPRSRRVLWVSGHPLGLGGGAVDTQSLSIVRGLSRKGYEIAFLANGYTGPARQYEHYRLLPMLRDEPTSRGVACLCESVQAYQAIYDFGTVIVFLPIEEIRQRPAGLPDETLFWYQVCSERTPEAARWPDSPRRDPYLDWLVSYPARQLVLLSRFAAEQLDGLVAPDELTVIPHGVDLGHFRPRDPREALAQLQPLFPRLGPALLDSFVVGNLARNSTEKNLDLLLAAFARFASRNERAVLLLRAFPNGRWDLPALIAQLGLTERVLLLDRFLEGETLSAFYNLLSVYVVPSAYEGFGIPVIEAAACGTPVVANGFGPLAEKVRDLGIVLEDPPILPESRQESRYRYGLDQEKLAAVLEDLAHHPRKRQELARRGIEAAAAYGIDRVCDLWDQAIQTTSARRTLDRRQREAANDAAVRELVRGAAPASSGSAAEPAVLPEASRFLEQLIRDEGITSIQDAGCGDFGWMGQVDRAGASYVGFDVLPWQIAANRRRHPEVSFAECDLLAATLPRADLVVCRDLLCRLTTEDAQELLRRFRESGARLLVADHWEDGEANEDLAEQQARLRYGFRRLNLCLPPYSLGRPRARVEELAPASAGRVLACWLLSPSVADRKARRGGSSPGSRPAPCSRRARGKSGCT
ncbi:MAG: glycosyltransferase [Myxococcota bacterium]|jgi:glycosyltransferase involved in cell wall biosynthesis|nr:glycosyltransferase [Myxococcota bacterium]